MAREQTLVIIKPDGLTKALTGNVITRLSEAKLKIAAIKCMRVSKKLAEEHYKALKGKPFFEELINFIQGKHSQQNKVVAMVYDGEKAIQKVRQLAGQTNPEEADPVSIRGQFGRITTRGVFENVLHASSSSKEAEREIKLWFQPDEMMINPYPTKMVSQKITRKVWA